MTSTMQLENEPLLKIDHACQKILSIFYQGMKKKKNFSLEYYSKVVDNVTIPRLWLCYSPFLQKPYYEVCWLFSDGKNCSNRAWIDGVSGDIHNMADKISRDEKTKIHITTALIYSQWESGNTMDKDADVINKNNISFWTEVLQRLLSVILTLYSVNLAFCGHRETSYDGVCEGGNFLAIVYLMAQYDDVLGEVISLLSRAAKYFNHSIQSLNHLITCFENKRSSILVCNS